MHLWICGAETSHEHTHTRYWIQIHNLETKNYLLIFYSIRTHDRYRINENLHLEYKIEWSSIEIDLWLSILDTFDTFGVFFVFFFIPK